MTQLFDNLRPFILASKSPRRQQFLQNLGINYFTCCELQKNGAFKNLSSRPLDNHVPKIGVIAKDDTEERPKENELPEMYVVRSALKKNIQAIESLGFFDSSSIRNSQLDKLNTSLNTDYNTNADQFQRKNVGFVHEIHKEDRPIQRIESHKVEREFKPMYENESHLSSDLSAADREAYVRSFVAQKYALDNVSSDYEIFESEEQKKDIILAKQRLQNSNLSSDITTFIHGIKNTLSGMSFAVNVYSLTAQVIAQVVERQQENHTLNNPIIISADTIVALGNTILGKPQDEVDALNMLSQLVGREHCVHTSVCVTDLEKGFIYSFTDVAHVHFANWNRELLKAYVRSGEPMDKAGSYGIQGVGMFLSDKINGSWDTVAGLPTAKLLELLLCCKFIAYKK